MESHQLALLRLDALRMAYNVALQKGRADDQEMVIIIAKQFYDYLIK